MNNTEAHSSRSLVYSFFPTLRQADTQIPLINWDTGSQHVNTEQDKQATVGAPYLFLCGILCFVHYCSTWNLYQMSTLKKETRWRWWEKNTEPLLCHVDILSDTLPR